jgi:hypothetical protein
MFGYAATRGSYDRVSARRLAAWAKDYLLKVAVADLGCAIAGVFLAAQVRFGSNVTGTYLALSLALPVLWILTLLLAGGYDARFIGTGSDEFRKVLTAGVSLTAALAIVSYAFKIEVSRGYVVIAMPSITALDLLARYGVRKRLHQLRSSGRCLLNVVAVGHELAVADLVTELRRDAYHGMRVVGACVARPGNCEDVAGVPVYGGLDDVTAAVKAYSADTVAVLACPEMDGVRLRSLAWELEKTGTDLCVSPALLDVAGPRTTVRPTAGLTLLHVDHPQLDGARLVVKDLFDRCAAAARPARRGGQIRRARPAQAGGQAGPDRVVAGQRAVRPLMGRVGPARPAVRGELVVRAGPADPVEDGLSAAAGVRSVLTGRFGRRRCK